MSFSQEDSMTSDAQPCNEMLSDGANVFDDNQSNTNDEGVAKQRNECPDCGMTDCTCQSIQCKVCPGHVCNECWGCTYCDEVCRCICKTCQEIEFYCTCPMCETCCKPGEFCRCSKCDHCYEKVSKCDCHPCNACGKKPYLCRCAEPSVPRMEIDFGQRLMSHIHITKIEQDQYGKSRVILRGGFTHVIAFRNPLKVWMAKLKDTFDTFRDIKTLLVGKAHARIETFKRWISFQRQPEVEKTHVNVATKAAIRRMVDRLAALPTDKPNIVFDMECHNLGPNERPCILSIRDEVASVNYLVDLRTLNEKAWITKSSDGITLRNIFEDAKIPKLIFAVAQDAVALFAAHRIRLAGVVDLQYMALLRETEMPYHKMNLSSCIVRHANLTGEELAEFNMQKFRYPNTWWRYKDIRPLLRYDKDYAINDLKYLARMYHNMLAHLDAESMQAVHDLTKIEIENACNWPDEYIPQGATVRPELHVWWRKHRGFP